MRRYRSQSAIAGLAVLLAASCSRGPSDAALAAQIKARFFSDSVVKTSAVTVAVNRGEVTLGGAVSGIDVELQALKLAMETEGVRKVNDKISVVRPPERPTPAEQAQAPGPRRSQKAVVTAAAAPAPEPAGPDQTQAAVPGTTRGAAQAQVPVQVAVVTPRPIVVAAPAEPAPGYAVPVPVGVVVDAPPSGDLRKPQSQFPVVLLATGPPGPATLFRQWGLGFNRANARARLDYQASGSTVEGSPRPTVDLGVFDMPIGNEQLSRALDLRVLRFPAAVWGVVPICNIGGTLETRNFSGEALAAVFSGKIANWDDVALRILNPQALMPSAPITVVHRSDPSDETWLFTDYLSAMSPDWKATIGGSPSVNWPIGRGAVGNAGVVNLVKSTPNSIGYVDASFAFQNVLRRCAVQNRAGRLAVADPGSLAAAAASAREFSAPVLNALETGAYPIASLLWLGAPRDNRRYRDKQDAMRSFVGWMLRQGQPDAAALGYGPLPTALVRLAEAQIRLIF